MNELEIVPIDLAVTAMRDSGYKNTAYALAELIDNSFQANANEVEVICIETPRKIKTRVRHRIQSIAVIDNGTGMSSSTLRIALQFGNGTRLTSRDGIGRFGMGLPNSSISQCRKVEVWTWMSGPDNAMYTYLDVDEIKEKKMRVVPSPVHKKLPGEWRNIANNIGTSGTLVLWTNFDDHRLSWRGAQATLKNTESLIGRMYRKFINKGKLSIRLLALRNAEEMFEQFARVNDPLYLMPGSSTPSLPDDNKPMFQQWGEKDEDFLLEYNGRRHKIIVRMSWARPETVPADGSDRGAKAYGKHAAKNVGLSVVREGRELELNSAWANHYDPTERWWGIEVEFPSSLDEIFGVTNTKQEATIFSRMSQFDPNAEKDSDESEQEFVDRIKSDGDPRGILYPVTKHIRIQLQEVRKRLKDQTKGHRGRREGRRHELAEDVATRKFLERAKKGYSAKPDDEEFTEDDRKNFEDDLREDKAYPEDVAKSIADAAFRQKRKVVFVTKRAEGYAFFNVEYRQGGLTAIVFNNEHPLYKQLMESLDPDVSDESDVNLLNRVHKASDTLYLLFAAWARYEMEEVQQQEQLSDMRQEWGKMARVFLKENEGK